MVFADIKQGLNQFVERYDSQTYLGSYRETSRSSLLNEGLSTRANSLWKMAEYVVAQYDNNTSASINDYISGWKTLASNANNQYLIIEENKSDWAMYDAKGNRLGGEDFIREYFSKMKKSGLKKISLGDTSIHQYPLQQIFYGAPGTGKSHRIKKIIQEHGIDEKEQVIRTTFHPDSDYSTFVGCYKPISEKSVARIQQPILDYDSLVDKFKEYLNVPNANITKACTLFGYDYHDSIVRMQEQSRKIIDLVNDAYRSNTTYDSVVRGGMACYENNPMLEQSSRISYSFVPQAFVQAYTKAWTNHDKPVILVIEEINRGNCAQIFGDIFQLLDRGDDGVSDYEIKPDNALEVYLKGYFAGKDDVPEDISNGEIMKLPSNLYIWATMNTSDQSLFPIDSAFKRRWEWKYLPINNHEDKNYRIEIGSTKYDWWGFLSKINQVIGDTTSSEDKKLGYFFAKANDNGIVTAEQFVGKVLFYLWNDVFKNYGFDNQIFDKGDKKKFEFSEFFKQDGSPDTEMVNKFLGKLDETIEKENSFVEKPIDDKGQEESSDSEA